jgi:hypothetical protein
MCWRCRSCAWQQTNNIWQCLLLVLDMHKQEPTRSWRSCLSALLRNIFKCASCTMRSVRWSTNSSLASDKPLACTAISLQRQHAPLGSRLQRDRQPEAKQDQQPVSYYLAKTGSRIGSGSGLYIHDPRERHVFSK